MNEEMVRRIVSRIQAEQSAEAGAIGLEEIT